MKLVALQKIKGHLPGQVFEASESEARVLKVRRQAKEYVNPDDLAPLNEPMNNERAALRDEFMRVSGRRPLKEWDEGALREKIAGYETRQMRASR